MAVTCRRWKAGSNSRRKPLSCVASCTCLGRRITRQCPPSPTCCASPLPSPQQAPGTIKEATRHSGRYRRSDRAEQCSALRCRRPHGESCREWPGRNPRFRVAHAHALALALALSKSLEFGHSTGWKRSNPGGLPSVGSVNPEGIASLSPGLRAARYPGCARERAIYPERVTSRPVAYHYVWD